MYSVLGDTTSLVPGFPIRTSSDPRSVGSSPRLIAASNVLHRLPVPRHPPCALKHLQRYFCTKKLCTNQFGKIAHQNKHHHTPDPKAGDLLLLARCSQPLSTNQTPHPTTKDGATTRLLTRRPRRTGLLSQSPIVCLANSPAGIPAERNVCCAPNPRPLQHWDSSRLTPTPIADVSRGAP